MNILLYEKFFNLIIPFGLPQVDSLNSHTESAGGGKHPAKGCKIVYNSQVVFFSNLLIDPHRSSKHIIKPLVQRLTNR